MFWNKISPVYDLFENIYNRKVYKGTGKKVAEYLMQTDDVLECACGTGEITCEIAQRCRTLIATDLADGMLRRAQRKCRRYNNVSFQFADITDLKFENDSFDKVVAGNVIHLLPEPEKALGELDRVVRPGGRIIIPTYINMTKRSSGFAVKLIEKLGADFKRQFEIESYKHFFEDLGYECAEYHIVEGRMPCAVAVITKRCSSV